VRCQRTVLDLQGRKTRKKKMTKTKRKPFTVAEAKTIGGQLGIDWERFDFTQFHLGLNAELADGTHNPLTSFATDDKIFPAIKAGVLGYRLKDVEPEELVTAIQQVHRGEPSLPPNIARKLLREIRQPPLHTQTTPDPLTARELEVLSLVAKGLDNQTIANRLTVTEVTVRTHISHILDKLHLANRVQATLYALRTGFSSLANGLAEEG
jgi:DNA-binding CsgD family transcriptional regulator